MLNTRLLFKHIKSNKHLTLLTIFQVIIVTAILNFVVSAAMSIFSYCIFATGFNDPQFYEASDTMWEHIFIEEAGINHQISYEDFYVKSAEIYSRETGIDIEKLLHGDIYDYSTRWLYQHGMGEDGEWKSVSYNDSDSNINATYIQVENIANENPIISDISSISLLRFEAIQNERFTARYFNIIDDNIADRLKMNVYSGKNISETQNTGNIIEAIVTADSAKAGDVKLGESFDIRLYNFLTDEYETKKVTIVGFLDSPYYSMNTVHYIHAGQEFKLENLVSRIMSKNVTKNLEIYIKPFEGYNVHAYFPEIIKNFYFNVSESATPEEIKKIQDDFLLSGFTARSVKEAYDNSWLQAAQTLQTEAFTIIIGVVISVCTAIGATFLMLNRDKKKFKIYSIVGASPISNTIISVFYTLFILVISGIVSFLALRTQTYLNVEFNDELFGLTFDGVNVAATLVFYTLILATCSIISLIHFRKRNIS
jgi:hypothetical protein